MSIPIICLNLETSHDRRQTMIARAQQAGINLHFFKAINGRQMPQANKFICCRYIPGRQASYIVPERDYTQFWLNNQLHLISTNLTQGEAGLALTLFQLWNELIAHQVPWAIILEDDVEFSQDFVQHYWQLCQDLPSLDQHEIEFVYLNDRIFKVQSSPPESKLINNRYCPVQGGFGFDGYLISQVGMRKLLDLLNPLIYPVDLQILPHVTSQLEWAEGQPYREKNHLKPNLRLKAYKYHQNLVVHTQIPSTIHDNCPLGHIKTNQSTPKLI